MEPVSQLGKKSKNLPLTMGGDQQALINQDQAPGHIWVKGS